MKKLFCFSFWFLLLCMQGFSFEPKLNRISPLGGEIGKEVKVTVHGSRLHDFTGLLFANQQIKVIKTIKVSNNKIDLLLKINENCKPGRIGFRVVTKTGISLLRVFSVNHFPVIQSAEPNSSFKNAQVINGTRTVEGVITSEDIDFYAIDAKPGQRISLEVEGLRLGYTFFDPLVAVYNTEKKLIKVIDDTLLLK